MKNNYSLKNIDEKTKKYTDNLKKVYRKFNK